MLYHTHIISPNSTTQATNATLGITLLKQVCYISTTLLLGRCYSATSLAVPRGPRARRRWKWESHLNHQSWSASVYSCHPYNKTCGWWWFQMSTDGTSHFTSYQYLGRLFDANYSPSCDTCLSIDLLLTKKKKKRLCLCLPYRLLPVFWQYCLSDKRFSYF